MIVQIEFSIQRNNKCVLGSNYNIGNKTWSKSKNFLYTGTYSEYLFKVPQACIISHPLLSLSLKGPSLRPTNLPVMRRLRKKLGLVGVLLAVFSHPFVLFARSFPSYFFLPVWLGRGVPSSASGGIWVEGGKDTGGVGDQFGSSKASN